MHFYIVILYLSQLDLHATLNAASRMYLLKSWGQCNASFVTFYVNKEEKNLLPMHESSTTIGAF